MERKKRKHRHSRSRQQVSYIVTDNVLDILCLLARYKYLRSSSIHTLLPDRSRDGLLRTLRRMFDAGLIDKPLEQRRGYNNLYAPDIYMLDRDGEQALLERGVSPKAVTRLYRQATDGPIKNFAHAMMICDTLASLEAGARERLIPWTEIVARTDHPEPMKLACSITHTFGSRMEKLDTAIVPDGLFGIRYQDGKVAFFALECEHFNPIEPNTLGRSSFLKKMLAYRDISRREEYKSQLKIPNLRVVVVGPTPTRIQHMKELAERLVGESNLFLFQSVPVQEEIMKAPPPFPELFNTPWLRAGLPPLRIDTN